MKQIALALLALGIATPAFAQSPPAQEWTWKATGQAEVTEGLFQDSRTGMNGRYGMVRQFRQS